MNHQSRRRRVEYLLFRCLLVGADIEHAAIHSGSVGLLDGGIELRNTATSTAS